MNVDVVVVTYNSAEHLPAMFEALPPGLDVTVVDNASSDASAAVAEGLGAEVVRGEVNAGFAVGCNRGAALGSAEIILFLNPDATIGSADLATLLAAFDDPSLGVASPRLRRADGSEQRARWPFPSVGLAWRDALGLGRFVRDGADGFVVGACFAVRRAAFEAVGGFDERFWLYGEETDLCRRLLQAGWRLTVVDGATAGHVGKASGGSDSSTGLIGDHFVRGGEHFVAKHAGPASLVSYRLALLVGSALRGGLGLGRRAAEHRWRARRVARSLLRSPRSVALDSPATRAPARGLVVCSLEAWDEVWRRNQFLVRELLAAHPDTRVLFVEPPFDVVHERRLGRGRRRRPGLRPLEEDGRVVRFEPVKWLPRKLGPCADRWRDAQVRRAVRSLGFEDPTLWVNDPSYASLAETVDWAALYDITDDWTRLGGAWSAAAGQERRLLARCDAVVVCSPELADSRRAGRPDVALVPNAVDAAHLRRPRPRPPDLPGGAVALYVGTLHEERLDLDLVDDLAAAMGDVTVLLVGPDALSDAARERLAGRSNVVLAGPRPYADVPAYLQHADVLIVPHAVSPFTESLDPIKLYECLAVGRPTVATPVAGFRGQGEPVRVAGRGDFVTAVKAVLASAPPKAECDVPSWADRAADFRSVIEVARRRAADRREGHRLRVAYVDHCARLSGAELALARLLPALEGVDPVVILGEHGPLEGALAERGIPVEVLALDRELADTRRADVTAGAVPVRTLVATVRDTAALARRLRRLRPDIVHTNSLKAALLGGVAGRLAGVPVVWHVRDRIADDYLPAPAVKLVRAAARVLPTAVIANSRSTRATLGRRWSGATVIGSPVVYDSVESTTGRVAEATDRTLRVAMVGRISAWKGQDVFLDAFAQAFAGGPESAVIAGTALFGEEALVGELEARAVELGVDGQVDFAGFVHDVPGLLGRCDVLVHASVLPEPFGQVVIEGMAAGLAVVASDGGGPAEVVTDGVDGLLFPPGDAAALAGHLRRLGHDPDLRARLGEAGRRRAADFAPAVVAAEVSEVYRHVAGGPGRPRPVGRRPGRKVSARWRA